MKLFTKHTDYAVRALAYLSQTDRSFISSRQIAKQERIPEYFLKGILQRLIKEGILESKEGVAGGVRLKRDPGKISVVELVRIFQGTIQLSECRVRKQSCPNRSTCMLRKKILTAERKLLDEFKDVTIASLLKEPDYGAR